MADYADALPAALNVAQEDLEREFERLLAESSTLAFRVAYAVLRQREDAEDVAQEAMIRAHQGFRRIRERGSFRAWLVRTTWRLALDRQRANRRRLRRELEHGRDLANGSADDSVVRRDVWHAIDALPDRLRLAIVLAGIHGHDVRAVAELLGVPEGTVKSRLFLARERMRKMLQWSR